MYKKVISAAALLALSVSSAAFATSTGNAANQSQAQLTAIANVDANCSFQALAPNNAISGASSNSFNFGDITASEGTTITAGASLSYTCNGVASAPQIALQDLHGTLNSTTFDLQNQTAPNNLLDYTIAQTNTPANPFSNSSNTFQGVASSPIQFTASLKVPTTLPAGSYTDTITATINP